MPNGKLSLGGMVPVSDWVALDPAIKFVVESTAEPKGGRQALADAMDHPVPAAAPPTSVANNDTPAPPPPTSPGAQQ